jgi:hypothetical protein
LAATPFSVAQNLIPDPTISFGVDGWTPIGATIEWIGTAGVDGLPGFARLTGPAGPGAFFARGVCRAVQPGEKYSWGGFLRVSPTPDNTARFQLVFFADYPCGGPSLLTSSGPTLAGATAVAGTWYLRQGPNVVPPPLARSVSFEVVVDTLAGSPRSVDIDNVFLGPGAGPPSAVAVPTLSTWAVLTLVAILAAAGVWRLVSR